VFSGPHINIVLKIAFLNGSIWKLDLAIPMLDTSLPLPYIDRAICPPHLSMSMPLIILIKSLMDVPSGPFEDPLSVFLIFFVLSFIDMVLDYTHRLFFLRVVGVDLFNGFLPDSFAFFETCLEGTLKCVSVGPSVLSLSIWLAIFILSVVDFSISELFGSFSMLKTESPLALVSVSVGPCMHPRSVSFVILPLTYIVVSSWFLPDAKSTPHTLSPLPIIAFSALFPLVDALPMSLTIEILALIAVSIDITLKPSAVADIVVPIPFKKAAISVPHDSLSLPYQLIYRISFNFSKK
jgi:hypothetical protein